MSGPMAVPGVMVCAVRETVPGEQRVALVPESVPVPARAGCMRLWSPAPSLRSLQVRPPPRAPR